MQNDLNAMNEAMRLANDPATKKLIHKLQEKDPNAFANAMKQASSGDYAQAKKLIEDFMQDPEMQKLLAQFGR